MAACHNVSKSSWGASSDIKLYISNYHYTMMCCHLIIFTLLRSAANKLSLKLDLWSMTSWIAKNSQFFNVLSVVSIMLLILSAMLCCNIRIKNSSCYTFL